MKLALKSIFTLLLISISISACGGAATEQPALDELLTASVGTMVYSFFETQTAMYTPVTATPISTPTFLPTFTPFPSPTLASQASSTPVLFAPAVNTFTPGAPTTTGTPATATVNANALAFGCNNLAFIRDVTVPAGTVLQKKEEFTKTWKVQNTGTCNWTFQFHLVLLSGDGLKASGDYIGKTVTVWDWQEISIHLTAPNAPGTYTSYWRMVDAGGNMFGETLVLSFVVAE